jgi:hypothetical protein
VSKLRRYVRRTFAKKRLKTAETLRANVLAQSAPKGSAFLPFTTRSLLEMCWGMTMNLSHETQQQELGKTLIQSSNSAFDKKKTDAANTDFLENLKMTFYCSVRNIGFIRASHVQYLDFNADRLTRRRQSLEQAADFASFSGSGLFTKIGSFLGVGSVFELVSKMNLPQIYIPIFAVGGVAGAFLTTFLVKIYVQLTDDSWEKKIWKKQSDYWKTEFKPDVTEELLHLYNAIKCLRTKFFPNADDELLSLKESEVKDFIRMNILPPDDLQWPPRTVAPTTDTTATTASDKQKKK